MEVNFTNLMRKAGEMLKYARFLWREGKSEREVGDDEKQNFKTGWFAGQKILENPRSTTISDWLRKRF